jgi:hypothetical protein
VSLTLSMDFSAPPQDFSAPPHNGTGTSRLAAIGVQTSGQAATDRERVLRAIQCAGERGITRADICHSTGLSGDTVRPRVWELMGKGGGQVAHKLLVVEQGERIPDCGGRRMQAVLVAEEASK